MKASEQIDAYVANLDDWRGETVARLRAAVASSGGSC
jgi:hypothetical protein